MLWTCREGSHLNAALNAARSWGLTFDFVNENPGFRKKMFGTDPRKVGADEYWEDRSIHPVKFVPEAPQKAEIKVIIDECGLSQGLYVSADTIGRHEIELELIDFVTDDEEELDATKAAYEETKDRAKNGELKVVWY